MGPPGFRDHVVAAHADVGRQQCSAAVASARRINPVLAAPSAVARHCRAKIGGAAGPAPSAVSAPGRRHVSPVPRHAAAQAFGRTRAIGAAKSVSFLKKSEVLDLKLVFKKC